MGIVKKTGTALAALALVLAACSGGQSEGEGNGPGGTDATPPTGSQSGTGSEADLERAATEMFLAFTSGDHQTYFNFLSQQCRDELGFAAVDEHLKGRRFRTDQAGIDVAALGVDSVAISGLSGNSAFVALTLSGTTELFEESVENRWIYEDGGWHEDDCENITPPQGGLEGFGTDRNEPVGYGFVADINGWLVTVSWIVPDDEELVVELGGQPAASGNILFNVQLNPYYNGSKASTVLGDDLAFAMVNGSTVYGDEADCAGSDPSFIDMTLQASPGDDIGFVFVCREVAEGHAEGMLLRVTDLATGADYWFDLTPP